jgi:hypothetical protein
MAHVFISPGKAQCRYCGEAISINALSLHIAQSHRRPVRATQKPTLIRRPVAASEPTTK